MGGGLMQLVAYGAQDIYLTGNPQITFFKVVYRRHTNFSMETIEQTLNGNTQGTSGSTATCTISRNGDLVFRCYVQSKESGISKGMDLIKECELEIGGQRIDRHYDEWNKVWSELSIPSYKSIPYRCMTGSTGEEMKTGGTDCVDNIHIPLNFWFCRNPGLALPLIALQYHEVKLKFTWGTCGAPSPNPTVYCDYIYLDTDERRRFAQVSHEYLIEQIQREEKVVSSGAAISGSGTQKTFKLNFNHPVKELIWTHSKIMSAKDIKLKLNGHDRFSEQVPEYFALKQPYDYHTNIPQQNLPTHSPASEIADAFLGSVGEIKIGKVWTPALATGASKIVYTVDVAGTCNVEFPAGNGVVDQVIPGDEIVLEITHVGFDATTNDVDSNNLVSTDGDLIQFQQFSSTVISKDSTNITFERQFQVGDEGTTLDSDSANNTGTSPIRVQFIKRVLGGNTDLQKKINVYSFALKPEEHQPSGTCNFSRIDNAQLDMTILKSDTSESLTVYAVNYNVLRIMSGMGGLAYSN